VDDSGTDNGTNWLDSAYNDSQSPWASGDGLFGYTPTPGDYPAIKTPLTSTGQNTFYFRTHFTWNNLPDNLAFVVTNYLSDGAVYYINGAEVDRIRMPDHLWYERQRYEFARRPSRYFWHLRECSSDW
jgi:hypothetical protein